jgi:phospholipid transport system substrate-binding protein
MRTLIALALVLLAGTAYAMSPTETVQSRVDQALQTLGSAGSRGGAETAEQRRQEIRRAAVALFDFTEMSRRALGRHWEERTDAEKTEFVRLFTELIARSYMGRLDRYAGEPVTWIGESVDGDAAQVQSRFVTTRGARVPVDYHLHRLDDRWAVYDVLVESVSLVGTYRSQFDRIIRTDSFAALLKRLRQKEQELTANLPSR